MARPRKEPDDRRSETLAIRLTVAERIRVEQAAFAAGLSASEYARSLVLAGRVVVRQNRALDHAAFDELRRIGVNLNQLTRLAGAPAGAISRRAFRCVRHARPHPDPRARW